MANWDSLEKREDWKARAALYTNGSRINSQKCEDLVARRILAGLGYTEKGINKIEAALEIPYDAGKPLYDRARTCLEIVSRGMFSTDRGHRKFALVCRETDDRHDMILRNWDEWIGIADAEERGAVVLGRVGSERMAWGYVILREGDLPPWILQHPAVLIQRRDGWWAWYREVCDLVYDMARFERWEVPGSVSFDPGDPVYG